MIRRLLMAVTARLPARAISNNNEPYLERYYVGTLFGWTFYIHRFLAGDAPHLHDHPWRISWSLILAGGYSETRLRHIDGDGVHLRRRLLRPGRLSFIRGTDFHRINYPLDGDAWTLFATHGPRVRRWGFLQWVRHVDTGMSILYELAPPADEAHATWHLSALSGSEMRARAAGRAA
jgi:hypothetical protein